MMHMVAGGVVGVCWQARLWLGGDRVFRPCAATLGLLRSWLRPAACYIGALLFDLMDEAYKRGGFVATAGGFLGGEVYTRRPLVPVEAGGQTSQALPFTRRSSPSDVGRQRERHGYRGRRASGRHTGVDS